jgi:hypothetical protein
MQRAISGENCYWVRRSKEKRRLVFEISLSHSNIKIVPEILQLNERWNK